MFINVSAFTVLFLFFYFSIFLHQFYSFLFFADKGLIHNSGENVNKIV